MTHDTDYRPFRPDELPTAVRRYLETHQLARDEGAAAAAFAPDARVVDENTEYRGINAIRGWLRTGAAQYTYTTELTGQRSDGSGRWSVRAHLEGDFPGAVVDLHLRFLVADDLIADLVIEP